MRNYERSLVDCSVLMVHDARFLKYALTILVKVHWDVTETKNWERGTKNGKLVTSTGEGKMKKEQTQK